MALFSQNFAGFFVCMDSNCGLKLQNMSFKFRLYRFPEGAIVFFLLKTIQILSHGISYVFYMLAPIIIIAMRNG